MKIIRYLCIFGILIFSFFYTEQIASLTLKNNKLYQEIDNKKDYYAKQPIDAVIIDNTIIPGLNGRVVDIKKSYYKMQSIKQFNPDYLVYKNDYPRTSLFNNKDKIITKGNSFKKSVSLVIEYNSDIINYLVNNNYQFSVLIDYKTFNNQALYEQINSELKDYKKVEYLLNKYHMNVNICYLNNVDICQKDNNYLVKTNRYVDNKTIINIKSSIASGDIYHISKNLSINNLELLIKSIAFKDLKIVTLSHLINEERD